MKNLKKISELSKKVKVSLYYSPKENAVYDEPGQGRFYLTDLIRENTPEKIKKTVEYCMSL